MKDYHINIFWSEDDGCYVADMPDLKYCSAFGDTPRKALEEVLKAKVAWLLPLGKRETPLPSLAIVLPSIRLYKESTGGC